MKIDFEYTTAYGKFCDALFLPDDHGLSDLEINALKEERLNNWIAAVTAPQDVVDTPVEEV